VCDEVVKAGHVVLHALLDAAGGLRAEPPQRRRREPGGQCPAHVEGERIVREMGDQVRGPAQRETSRQQRGAGQHHRPRAVRVHRDAEQDPRQLADADQWGEHQRGGDDLHDDGERQPATDGAQQRAQRTRRVGTGHASLRSSGVSRDRRRRSAQPSTATSTDSHDNRFQQHPPGAAAGCQVLSRIDSTRPAAHAALGDVDHDVQHQGSTADPALPR
jgi:hypothetical protein